MPADETQQPINPVNGGADTNADDIPAVYELETLEQLRAIADELRTRIVDALVHRAMTVTQLGELLGQAPAKIHYHVRELERVGLIRMVATREKSGILEKYYRAVARSMSASRALLSNAPMDESFAAMRSFLDNASRAFLQAAEFTFRNQLWERPKVWGIGTGQVWITHEEAKALFERIQKELDAFATPRGIEGEEERTIVMMGYDPRIAEQNRAGAPAREPSEAHPPDARMHIPTDTPSATHTGGRQPRHRRIVSAGATSFSRAQLEEALAQNQQLEISVIGVCIFPDDVTADLVDRAIARFRHRGVLTASPEVREALKRKE